MTCRSIDFSTLNRAGTRIRLDSRRAIGLKTVLQGLEEGRLSMATFDRASRLPESGRAVQARLPRGCASYHRTAGVERSPRTITVRSCQRPLDEFDVGSQGQQFLYAESHKVFAECTQGHFLRDDPEVHTLLRKPVQ